MDSQCLRDLERDGFTVIAGLTGSAEVERFLGDLGRLMPQYDGRIAFEVRPKPEFERYRYSQSLNPIGPHTEAPVHDPPPKYLALYCHHQATCGGGATRLGDGRAFLAAIEDSLRSAAESKNIDFVASKHPGGPKERLASFPMLSTGPDGETIFRFSHNQFYFGDVNPSVNGQAATPAVVDDDIRELAVRGTEFLEAHAVGISIPDGSLLVWDNHRMSHARGPYRDPSRHLTRYWIA